MLGMLLMLLAQLGLASPPAGRPADHPLAEGHREAHPERRGAEMIRVLTPWKADLRAAWLFVATIAVLVGRADGRGPRQSAGDLSPARTDRPAAGAPRGALVICGGGRLPESARREFVRLAGGPKAKIVAIPTASEDADGPAATLAEFTEPWRKQGVASAVLLHTRSRARADEPGFTRPLEEATGVWFSGGDQSRVTDAYLGTAVERALHAVLDRGGVLGGTSAGAALMSRVMITGGQDKATVGTGFGFLPGAVVDEHALWRNRVNRLLGVLADHPDLLGVAIDELTALVVREGRREVMGDSYVVTCRAGRRAADPDRRLPRRRSREPRGLEAAAGPGRSATPRMTRFPRMPRGRRRKMRPPRPLYW